MDGAPRSDHEVLTLGVEAVAYAAFDAGIKAVFGYPGTPSTEGFERAEALIREEGAGRTAHCAPNEKVAYEFGLGVSYAGHRVLVTMKHVGLNVAMDAFVNSAMTGVQGGFVVLVADDPGMHSSQNEQDSRYLADFANLPSSSSRRIWPSITAPRAGSRPASVRDPAGAARVARAPG